MEMEYTGTDLIRFRFIKVLYCIFYNYKNEGSKLMKKKT